jgi:hypothetical protein
VIIEGRFNGPAGSGNGGYTAGLVASELAARQAIPADHTAQVTLRLPPPLETPLQVAPTDGGIEVYEASRLVAEAVPVRLAGDPVAPVPYPEAVTAAAAYPGFVDHPFPACYVCGPDREPDDGLRIFPGPVAVRMTAAPWLVPDEVSPVTVWAALDCPGGWAIIEPGRAYVLGRMAARVAAVPPAGARCVVVGAVAGTDGRKAEVRTALYGPGGDLLADAHATWIALQTPARGTTPR